MSVTQLARVAVVAAALAATAAAAQDTRPAQAPAGAPARPAAVPAVPASTPAGPARTTTVVPARAATAGPARSATAVPAASADTRTNEQRRDEMDKQHERWNSTARRAIGSICAGCGGAKASPQRRAKSPRAATRRPARASEAED